MPRDYRHKGEAYDRARGLIPVESFVEKTCAGCRHYERSTRTCLVKRRKVPPTNRRCGDFGRRGL